MKRVLLTLLTISFQIAFSQVGIGTTAPNAQLDIAASSAATPSNVDGLLIPRVDAFPAVNPTAPQNGILIFLTTAVGTNLPGFYYWSQPALAWVGINSSNKSWDVSGNSSAVSGTNFIGTINAQDVDFRANNQIKLRLSQKGQLETLNSGKSVFIGEQAGENDDLSANNNVFIGYQNGLSNVDGYDNVAIGYQSFKSNTTGFKNAAFGSGSMFSNTTGTSNTASGFNSLYSNTSGIYNTAVGANAMFVNTTAIANTAIGTNALRNNNGNNNTGLGAHALRMNGLGYGNTAVGGSSLLNNTDGYFNTAIGFTAMISNATGFGNTASGSSSLYTNISGSNNTATGLSTLLSNETGNNNTATGAYALRDNVSGGNNTATGRNALRQNGTGNGNTASGFNCLVSNTSGSSNTVSGSFAMITNTTGDSNIAMGSSALYYNLTGSFNTGLGLAAILGNVTGDKNTGVGYLALSTNASGNNNTAVGNAATTSLTSLSNATSIGNQAVVNASNKVRLGSASVTIVEGQVPYFNPSDARFKNNVKSNVPGLDFILKLKPVTYHFDTKKFDEYLMQNMPDSIKTEMRSQNYSKSSAIVHTGFLAQDIEQAAQSIGYDFDGLHKPDASNPTDNYSVAYSQFVIPLVQSIQEQQQQIEAQHKAIEVFKTENNELRALAAQQQKMMDQLERRISSLEKQ